jgi:hypothetical protein
MQQLLLFLFVLVCTESEHVGSGHAERIYREVVLRHSQLSLLGMPVCCRCNIHWQYLPFAWYLMQQQ